MKIFWLRTQRFYDFVMAYDVEKEDSQWREELTAEEYAVLRQAATERPWTGELLDEKRDGVRAALTVEVQFSVVEPEAYKAARDKHDVRPIRLPSHPGTGSIPGEEDKASLSRLPDSDLIDFLIQIEDKLDLVLKLLAKQDQCGEELFVGEGLDIGGGGMRIVCDKEVAPGQILDARFRIFRYPVVTLAVFGKVVRVRPCEKDGRGLYEVALEFLDLDEDYKEWIISYVFQIQREAIRNLKRG